MQGSIEIIMKECTQTAKPAADASGLHYNFVFFFAHDDFWKAILGEEIYECENVRVYEGAFEGSELLKKLFHYHWAYSVNRRVCLPLKSIWFRKMYRQDFKNDLPLCFVYMGSNSIRYDGGFCDYVRRASKENRQVVLCQDLIGKKTNYDYSLIRDKMDLCITYDKEEAKRYGIQYFQETTFSKLIPEPAQAEFEQDVYFLGAAKDRLPKILSVHRVLTEAGLKCKFLIAGVPKEQQVEGEGIVYTTGIPYKENLENVVRSKCVLELIQGDSVDITTRALEAIAYRRRLITDCQICDPAYFNEGQLLIISDPETIDPAFVRAELDPEAYPPRLDLDPLKRLYFIQEQLEKQDAER